MTIPDNSKPPQPSQIARLGAIAVAATMLVLPPQAYASGDGAAKSAAEIEHFDPKGKMPSQATIKIQNALRAALPFDDRRDFEEARRGFISAPSYIQIEAEAGNVAWDMQSYQWLLEGKDYDSINPSLQRQATLNMGYGLFEVMPDKIYQVRGYDLSNISFIKSDTGWIIFDPLVSRETAGAALASTSGG